MHWVMNPVDYILFLQERFGISPDKQFDCILEGLQSGCITGASPEQLPESWGVSLNADEESKGSADTVLLTLKS